MVLRFLFFTAILIFVRPVFCQDPISSQFITIFSCDTIILKNGDLLTCKIQEIKKKKVIYNLCCPECAVPREIALNDIDTIIQLKKQEFEIEEEQKEMTIPVHQVIKNADTSGVNSETNISNSNEHVIMLKKSQGKTKNIILQKGTRLEMIFQNGNVVKGRLAFSSDHEVLIDNYIVDLNELNAIIKKSRTFAFAGGITGTAATLTSIWLSTLGAPILSIPLSATLYTMMLIRKKYKLRDYELYLLYQ